MGSGLLAGAAFAASFSYLAVAYWIVFVTRIGPVAVVVDSTAKHGVHSGDLLALPLVVLAGMSFFMGVVALERALRPRSRTPWRVPVTVAPLPTVVMPVVVPVTLRFPMVRPAPAALTVAAA